jgi:hypothetical protein
MLRIVWIVPSMGTTVIVRMMVKDLFEGEGG